MKFTVEVETKTWFEVSWQEEVENYDQREGSYKSWLDREEKLISKIEADNLIKLLKPSKTSRKILFKEISEIK